MIDKELKGVLKISGGLVLLIHFTWLLLYILGNGKVTVTDKLNKLFVDIKIFGRRCCSLWPITHFIFYGILTYMYPAKWKEIFVLGLLWELYEFIMSKIFIQKTSVISKDSNLQYDETWWAAEPLDVLFNTLGIILALLIRHIQKNGKLF